MEDDTYYVNLKYIMNDENKLSMDDLKKLYTYYNVDKKVRFNCKAQVKPIPSRGEYHNDQLISSMWWNEHDYTSFQEACLAEVRFFIKISELQQPHIKITYNQAMHLLYQPHNCTRVLCNAPYLNERARTAVPTPPVNNNNKYGISMRKRFSL